MLRIHSSKQILTLIMATVLCVVGCSRHEPAEEPAADAPALSYGTKVTFGQGGNSELFREVGWSKTEEKFTWTEGTGATLRMRIPAASDPITLRMKLSGLVREPALPYQTLEVRANGEKVAEWQVSNLAEFAGQLPPAITQAGGELTISLKIPKAASPKSLGINEDLRMLGICCFEFELSKG